MRFSMSVRCEACQGKGNGNGGGWDNQIFTEKIDIRSGTDWYEEYRNAVQYVGHV